MNKLKIDGFGADMSLSDGVGLYSFGDGFYADDKGDGLGCGRTFENSNFIGDGCGDGDAGDGMGDSVNRQKENTGQDQPSDA